MRFLRISTPYREYLKRFYAEHSGLGKEGYCAQQRALLTDGFQQLGSYCFHLSRLGYVCEEIIANAAPLQRAWCRERGVPWRETDYDLHATLAQAARFQPEVVFLVNARRFSWPWISALRSACPRLRCVLGWWGVDVDPNERLKGLDLVLTCNQELARDLRQLGAAVAVLPFAFDGRVLNWLDATHPPAMPLTFVGSVRRRDGFHGQRARLLEVIGDRFDLEVFTHDHAPSALASTGRLLAAGLGQALRFTGLSERRIAEMSLLRTTMHDAPACRANGTHPLWKRVHPPVYGRRYLQTLRDSEVTLNVHPGCAGEAAGNIRLFESTGVGTCLFTDWKRDLHKFFELDCEVVAFKSDAECLEKLAWIQAHGEARKAIAKAGQNRTLREHHFFALAQRLDEIIRHLI